METELQAVCGHLLSCHLFSRKKEKQQSGSKCEMVGGPRSQEVPGQRRREACSRERARSGQEQEGAFSKGRCEGGWSAQSAEALQRAGEVQKVAPTGERGEK